MTPRPHRKHLTGPHPWRERAALSAAAAMLLVGLLLSFLWRASENISPWRMALSAESTESGISNAAYLRAKTLHEAEVRPLLVEAGFYHARNRLFRDQDYRPEDNGNSLAYTNMLWSFRDFPRLYRFYLELLLDGSRSQLERDRLFILSASAASALIQASGADKPPASFLFEPVNPDTVIERMRSAAALDHARKNFLERYCLLLADDIQASLAQGFLPPMSASGNLRIQAPLAELARWAPRSLRVMLARVNDEPFQQRAWELLSPCGGNIPWQRHAAVQLMDAASGLPLADYRTAAPYASILRSIDRALADGSGPVSLRLDLSAQRGRILDSRPGSPHAPCGLAGCTLSQATQMDLTSRFLDGMLRHVAERELVFVSGNAKRGMQPGRTAALTEASRQNRLYLYTDQALPDLPSGTRVMRGSLLVFLTHTPMLYPVDGLDDEALLALLRNRNVGASVLLSSQKSQEDVAAHLEALHLMGRSGTRDSAPRLMYTRWNRPAFLESVLPRLSPDQAAAWFGPVDAIWYGFPEEEGMQIHTVTRPEGVEPPDRQPFFLLDSSAMLALNREAGRQEEIRMARALLELSPAPAQTPAQAVRFVHRENRYVLGRGIINKSLRSRAIAALWTLRAESEKEAAARALLDDRTVPAAKRVADVEALAGTGVERKGGDSQ